MKLQYNNENIRQMYTYQYIDFKENNSLFTF